jgi:uncharacterized protein (TIGR02118 family)
VSRFAALYRLPDDPAALEQFERGYASTHLPLVKKTPGLVRIEASRVRKTVFGKPALHLLAIMTFRDEEAMKSGLASEEWAASGRNLAEIGGLDLATMVILDDPEVHDLTT